MSRSSTMDRPGRIPGPVAPEGAPDRVLLDRFLSVRDEGAFEALVRRHGPEVLRICRRRLEGAEAEDAFQATFLALVSQAGRIREADSLAAWLRSVARRVAGRARARAAIRRGRERSGVDIHEFPGRDEGRGEERAQALRAEVARLPDKYRRAVELCCWQGLSCEQAADRLDCPAGTVKWRLSRAREILRGRLERLGLAVAVLLSWIGAIGSASASSTAGRLMPEGRRPRGRRGEPGPSDDLVRRTVDLAARSRHGALAIFTPPADRLASRGRRRRGWALRAGLTVALTVAIGYAASFLPPFRRLVAASTAVACPPSDAPCH